MKRKIFISHKNDQLSIMVSKTLNKRLKQAGFETFFDKDILVGGMNWREKILGELLKSDVLLLVIDEETVESNWVQREIDTARAADISILPVVVGGDFVSAKATFDRNELGWLQFVVFDASDDEPGIQEIINQIEPLSLETIEAQKETWDEWKDRHPTPKKKFQKKLLDIAVTLKHADIDDVEFCIATGDATRIKGYDILVNTENNYMQMARFFESKTLSWAIRTRGALLKNGENLIEDTIQDDLYRQIRHAKLPSPIPVRTVIVTSAGNSESKIQKQTQFRYIFHVASVRIEIKKQKVTPVGDTAQILENCFNLIQRMDEDNGQVLYDENGHLSEVPSYQSPKSILFPVFGVGEGGNPLEQAVEEFVKGLKEDDPLIALKQLAINKIGLSIFNYADLESVIAIFKKHGFEMQD